MDKIVAFFTAIFVAIVSFFTPAVGNYSVKWTGYESTTEKVSKIETSFKDAAKCEPKIKYMTDYDYKFDNGIVVKAITYDSMPLGGKKTKAFAYIAIPRKASATNKVPAVVLIHGGGSHAYYTWAKNWLDRGYAAIAMDNTGYFPDGNGGWTHGLSGDFKQTGYTATPDCDGVKTSGEKVDTQWIYQATGQVILAANVLRELEGIDENKIGLVGVSWGAVLGTMALGYDSRFAFGVLFYGCGNLDSNLTLLNGFKTDESKSLWLVQKKYSNFKMPVMWVSKNNDENFSVNTNSMSYDATRKYNSMTTLNIVNDLVHSQNAARAYRWQYDFANSVVLGGPKLTNIKNQPQGKSPSCTFSKSASASSVSAKLYYITQHLSYTKRTINQTWKTVPCTVSGSNVTANLPSGTKEYYIEITSVIGGEKYYTTSKIVIL